MADTEPHRRSYREEEIDIDQDLFQILVLILLVAIGALLFATLQAVRRKDRTDTATGTEATAGTEKTPAFAASAPASTESEPTSTSSDGDDYTDTYETLTGEATTGTDVPETIDSLEETPEWEPHAAARATPDEGVSDVTPEDEEPPLASDTPPEEIWADPTPTAMSDAAALEQATSTASDEPETFSSFLDDEPATEDPAITETPAPIVDEPFATQDPATDTGADLYASTAEAEPAVSPGDDLPEEEPFERAGRWWFKRGSELLVYNEQSGEWVPSPTPLPSVERAPTRFEAQTETGPTQTISDIASIEPEPEPEPELESAAEAEPELVEPTAQQGFWRCPACGAVNGSTSATCRMCFAARPAPGA